MPVQHRLLNCFAFGKLPGRTVAASLTPLTPTFSRQVAMRFPLLSPSREKKAFSLVLSLAVMTMVLLGTLSLAALLTLELGSSRTFLLQKRARLNAQVAFQIALGQLQQETGPDRRVTAQANVTLPTTAAATRAQWEQKNPYWTGAWDTRNATRPPAWLVSGEKQTSLAGATSYPSGYAVPWNISSASDPGTITLFSSENSVTSAPFDTQVSAPRVTIRDDFNGHAGHYAYWISDEGVKARLNLHDREENAAATSTWGLARLTAPAASAAEFFPDWDALGNQRAQLSRAISPASFLLLEGMSQGTTRQFSHAVTPHSQGLLTDVLAGGLKQDLSLAFEMTDADFNNSPFVKGNGRLTLNMAGTAAGVTTDPQWQSISMPIAEKNASRTATPIFNVEIASGKNLRGPTWEILRNYYRLYQEIENGTLTARSFYPNAGSSYTSGLGDIYIYNLAYASENVGSSECPHTQDSISYKNGKVPVLRPTKVAAMPNLTRFIMTFSLQREALGNDDYSIRLVINPIAILHNPYNIPIRFKGRTISYSGANGSATESVGYRLSYRPEDSNGGVKITYRQQLANGTWETKTISTDLRTMMGTSSMDPFRIFIPDVTIQPGEFKLFSDNKDRPEKFHQTVVLKEDFNIRGGYYIPFTLNGAPSGTLLRLKSTSRLSEISLSPSTVYIREVLDSWDGDDISRNVNVHTDFKYMSVHRELFLRDINSNKEQLMGKIDSSSYYVSHLPESGEPHQLLGIVEFFQKPSSWSAIPGSKYDQTPDNQFPVYTLSNPLSQSYRPGGNGRNTNERGFLIATPSWQTRMGKMTDWASVIETLGGLTFGGNSMSSAGQQHAVFAAIPLAPLSSLGQLQSANINAVDQLPLLAVGNSFPSPFVKNGAIFYTDQNWTNYDFPWLINTALWDHCFFSTIAPQGTFSSSGWTATKNQTQVWNDFLSGQSPLANQRLTPSPSATKNELAQLLTSTQPWRKSAALLRQNGSFNINATDPRAWKTILGSTLKAAIPRTNGVTLANGNQTVFPRTLPASGGEFSSGNETNPSRWNGVLALAENQLENLVTALLEKIRLRLSGTHHRVSYTGPNGEILARPFFSLAEFINRTPGSTDASGKMGVMQAAITQSGINDEMAKNQMSPSKLANSTQGKFPYPEAVIGETTNLPVPSAAAGHLLQGDIFQAIGPFLAARSDTFTIRAYGDVSSPTGQIQARAWLEAVVQRTPEYMDPAQPAHIAPANDPDGVTLNSLNQLLGRRYRVVSLRWLSPSEI